MGKQGSLRKKLFLAIFLPSLVISTVIGGMGLWLDLQELKAGLQREASVQADVMARAIRTPLSIGDTISAGEMLSAAGRRESLVRLAVYSEAGEVVAEHVPRAHNLQEIRQGIYSVRRDITMGKEVIGTLLVQVSLEAYYERRQWYILGGVMSLIALTGVAGAVASLLQKKLLDPLEQFTSAARAISTKKDYSVRVHNLPDEDFQPLTSAFNQMLDEIEKQTGALNVANAGLRTANKELEAFSYSVSHDLRTPLRAISSFAQILEQSDENLSDDSKQSLRVIQKNAAKMAQLIDDLLAFSRIDTHPIERREVDLTGVAQETWRELRPQTDGRKVQFTLEDLGVANVDPGLMHQVFINLLGNAVKYSRPKETSAIMVGRMKQNNRDVYFVRDNGVGFDMRYASKLFGVFERLHSEQEFEGTGVGLALVQRIINRHGGEIWAESEVGKGATFYFSLEEPEPKAPKVPKAAA